MNTFDENNFKHGARDLPEHYSLPESPQHAEIAGAMLPAVWVEKNPTTGFQTYPKRNQDEASDCVEYSLAKALGVDFLNLLGVYRELSPHSIYPLVVEPGGGSNSLTAANMVVQLGMTLEDLFESDGLTEAQAESLSGYYPDAKQIAMLYRPPNIVQCATDFETIASILQSYQQQGKRKVVMVTIYGTNNGTWLSTMPTPPVAPQVLWQHRISVTDFGLINGQKVLSFDNSWGTSVQQNGISYPIGNNGQQFLTKAYEPFMYGGIYTLDPSNITSLTPAMPKPKYTFTVMFGVGTSGPDVLALQQCLQSLGMFPVNSVVKPTGYFGGISKESVEMFQAAFGIPVTGKVDTQTILELNKIFA